MGTGASSPETGSILPQRVCGVAARSRHMHTQESTHANGTDGELPTCPASKEGNVFPHVVVQLS